MRHSEGHRQSIHGVYPLTQCHDIVLRHISSVDATVFCAERPGFGLSLGPASPAIGPALQGHTVRGSITVLLYAEMNISCKPHDGILPISRTFVGYLHVGLASQRY